MRKRGNDVQVTFRIIATGHRATSFQRPSVLSLTHLWELLLSNVILVDTMDLILSVFLGLLRSGGRISNAS